MTERLEWEHVVNAWAVLLTDGNRAVGIKVRSDGEDHDPRIETVPVGLDGDTQREVMRRALLRSEPVGEPVAHRSHVFVCGNCGVAPTDPYATGPCPLVPPEAQEPERAKDVPGICVLCGKPMPKGEEMFKFHGYSGPCPTGSAAKEEHDA